MQIQLAEKDCTGCFEASGNFGVFGRDTVVEDGAGCSGADACGVDIVFECDRDAVQRATGLACTKFGVCFTRLLEGRFLQNSDEGIELRLIDLDAGKAGFGELQPR